MVAPVAAADEGGEQHGSIVANYSSRTGHSRDGAVGNVGGRMSAATDPAVGAWTKGRPAIEFAVVVGLDPGSVKSFQTDVVEAVVALVFATVIAGTAPMSSWGADSEGESLEWELWERRRRRL